jgi:hypothetical protein
MDCVWSQIARVRPSTLKIADQEVLDDQLNAEATI